MSLGILTRLCALLGVFALSGAAAAQSANWLDPAWRYRSAVTISYSGATLLTSFQARVSLGTSFDFSKAKQDGSDLRFTASDGTSLLPFWIERWAPAQSAATLWVKVPSIPPGGATLFLYYGNSAAGSTASGPATFDFFDDFSSGAIGSARWVVSGGTWTVATDAQQDATSGAVAKGTTTSRQVLYSTYSASDYVVEAYGKQLSGRAWGLGVRASSRNNLYAVRMYDDLPTGNNLQLMKWVSSSSTTLAKIGVGVVNLNTWYKLSIKVHGSTLEVLKDDVLKLQASDAQYASGSVALYGEKDTIAEYNNVLVRKYAAAEPVASVGPATSNGVAAVAVSPASVLGGYGAVGTVTLGTAAPTGGATVTLVSSNPAVASVPVTVAVAAGANSATFPVSTTAVTATTTVIISASYSGGTQSAALIVNPSLLSVSVAPAAVIGSNSSVGTVVLGGAAPTGGALVSLFSTDPATATVPSDVTVSAGATTATFPVATNAVTSAASVTIAATHGSNTKTAGLTVAPGVVSLAVAPATVIGGNVTQGTVTLGAPAPVVGAVVTLSSSDSTLASPPVSITVPAGSTTGSFNVSTASVAANAQVMLSASHADATRTASLTVAVAISSLTLNPATVVGGNAAQGTVVLGSVAPGGGAAVALSTSNAALASVPASITVPAGQSSATFAVNTTTVAAPSAVTISAAHSGGAQSAPLNVNPAAWLDQGWMYRNPVSISNPGGTALSAFQVKVSLSSTFDFTKAASDGRDVRVTAADGVTRLPFWIEQWKPSQSTATLWVQVASIPAGGATLYLYSGNPSASTASDGNATFEFFDDFGVGVIDSTRWTVSGGTWVVVNDTQQDGTFGQVAKGTTSGVQMLYSKYKASDYVLEAYGKQLSGRVFGIGARVASSTSLYSLNLYGDLDSTNNLYLYRWSGTSAATLKSAAVGQVNASTWYKLSLKVHGSTIELYKDGALKGQATDSQIASGGVALYGESGTVAEFNNVIVRKYAAQEPAATVGAANAQGLSSLSISPATVVGGTPASGTVMLASVAPPGGAMVLLSSSGPQTASPPASVLVPAGASSAAFSVSTNAVLASQTVSISAQYGGVSRSAV